jgi:uncharacterized protein YjaG (DUF416 family)
MKNILTLIIVLIGFNSCSQNLNCSDFKKGKFRVIYEGEVENTYEVIRNGNFQTEVKILENGIPVEEAFIFYETIEWIDDCNYRLKIDESKMEMNSMHKLLNESNGILTEMTKIEENCFYFQATLKVNGQTEIKNGKICKE